MPWGAVNLHFVTNSLICGSGLMNKEIGCLLSTSGQQNLPRNFKANVEWALSNAVFDMLGSYFATPDIDPSACRLNHQESKICLMEARVPCFLCGCLHTELGRVFECIRFPFFLPC